MSITADQWILIAFVALAAVPIIVAKFRVFEWHSAKKAAETKLVLVPCDCGAETRCPQGRAATQTRCSIWKMETSL